MKLYEATQIHQKVNPKNSIQNFLETFLSLEDEYEHQGVTTQYWYPSEHVVKCLNIDANWVECDGVIKYAQDGKPDKFIYLTSDGDEKISGTNDPRKDLQMFEYKRVWP